MKNEQMQKTQTRQAPASRPPEARRKKPDPALLALLRGCMTVIAGMIFVVGLLLLILPMFRVKTIVVEGNQFHTAEEIIEASQIKVGQEILAIDKNKVNPRIWTSCKYVDEISIFRSFNQVRIVVTERKNVMYTEFNGNYFSLDRNFCVLEKSASEDAFADFLKVELPNVSSLSIGGTLHFEKADVDLSYITELIDILEEKGLLSTVTSLDFSKKYSVSYIVEESCRVELGKVSDMNTKLAIVEEILSLKGGATAAPSVVDVSNLQKPTYRVLGTAEALMAY